MGVRGRWQGLYGGFLSVIINARKKVNRPSIKYGGEVMGNRSQVDALEYIRGS